MASFINQIKGLIGEVTFSSTELDFISTYLRDGIVEISNRIIALSPPEAIKFTTTESTTGTDGIKVRGKILSVVRGHDSTSILRPCQIMDPGFRYEATDVDSLNYRSAYNPAYFILDGKVKAVPAPESDSALHVTHVFYDDSVTYEESSISNFPNEYFYLVVLFSSFKCIIKKLANLETSLPILVLPDPPIAPSLDLSFIESSGISDPTFTAPIMQLPDWGDVDRWISSEEDSEMSAARIQDIGTRISEFAAKMKEAEAQFNQETTVMQKALQVAFKNTELEESEEGRKLTKYQSDVQLYSAEVQTKVQEDQQSFGKIAKQYEWLTNRYVILKQDYEDAFGVIAAPMERQKKQKAAQQRQAMERR